MVEIDQDKGIGMRDLEPWEEGRARLKPNDGFEKVQLELLLRSSLSLGVGC